MIKRFLFSVLLAQCIFLVGANLLEGHTINRLQISPTTIAQAGDVGSAISNNAQAFILKPASSGKKSENHKSEAIVEFEEEDKSGDQKHHRVRGAHLSTLIYTLTLPDFYQAKEGLISFAHSIISVSTKRQLLFQVFRI